MLYTSWIGKAVVIFCLIWFISFPLFGGGARGKDLFATWASNSFLQDKKAGVPVLMLTIPILIAGSAASFFSTFIGRNHYRSKRPRNFCASGYCGPIIRQRLRLEDQHSVLIALIIFLPCLVYILSSMVRKLRLDMSIDTALSKSGNIFGMLAVFVCSWLLIPVSRKGPIGMLFAWDSIQVVNYHMWGGRIIIMASVIHGVEHTIRYALQGKDVWKAFFFPPIGCWKNPQTYKPETCDKAEESEDGCSCYDHFLPITGLAALAGLLLIGMSSRYKIRRSSFATFAMLHYTLAPLTFLAICVHYNKAILYASGSLLYYLASNFPSWIESFLSRRQTCGLESNVRILTAEKLRSYGDSNKNSLLQRPCIALTIEASETAVQKCLPGAFVYLLLPDVSKVSHPFTVNQVSGETKQIRIIFRATGPFTRALEKALFSQSSVATTTTAPLMTEKCDDETKSEEKNQNSNLCTEYHSSLSLPRVYLDGYYGSGALLRQISTHDNCVLVAAGIGITPYLSLFSELKFPRGNGISDGLMFGEDQLDMSQQPKHIILHWICRDRSLIEYCRKEYMDFSNDQRRGQKEHQGENCAIKIIIHQTGKESVAEDGFTGATSSADHSQSNLIHAWHDGGVPFELSKFSVADGIFGNLKTLLIFSILSWGGLWCLWRLFNMQEKDQYVNRTYTLVGVIFYELAVAILANFASYLSTRGAQSHAWSAVDLNGEENYYSDQSEVELSTLDSDYSSPPESVPVHLVEDPTRLQTTTLEMLHGRPNVENILEDLGNGTNPALFCCVPGSLEKHLIEGVNRKYRVGGIMTNQIAVYQESFVK
eukprot:jgi/Psemu1/206009/e_gw1.394.28.1